jgi:Peptidase M50B-like
MQKDPSPLSFAILMLVAYLILYYFGGSARQLLFPIIWLVAFLHETGHALGALVSGGDVLSLQINADGSGVTTTRGGSPGLILMGGYIGSAFLGNILFYIGMRKHRLAQAALYTLAVLMVFSAIKWPSSMESTVLLVIYAAVLFFVAAKTTWDQKVALFFGMASVVYIIQDFQVGPSSDLKAYEQYIGIFPAHIWKYIWLLIVLMITYWNVKGTFRPGDLGLSTSRNRR